jgi:hypothetical protein
MKLNTILIILHEFEFESCVLSIVLYRLSCEECAQNNDCFHGVKKHAGVFHVMNNCNVIVFC